MTNSLICLVHSGHSIINRLKDKGKKTKPKLLTSFMTSDSCQHHVTGVYRVDEIGREGASLTHPLNGASICLMNQDNSLQESLHMSLALHTHHPVSQPYIAVYTISKLAFTLPYTSSVSQPCTAIHGVCQTQGCLETADPFCTSAGATALLKSM